MEKLFKNKKVLAYAMLVFVIFVWGSSPPLNVVINKHYSVAFRSAVISLISALTLLLICIKKLKNLNKDYFKYAIPTGIFLSVASLVQKIGLLYTTPTKYAFLENISCVVVPIILFFAIKKKPSLLTIVSSVLCLVGMFILSGMNFGAESISFGKGELLCALAGVLYGVNIAYTGVKIKKFNTLLYLLIQQWASTIVSLLSAMLLSVIKVNGEPIEAIRFSFDFGGIALLVVLALVSNVLCWFLRTYAMKFVNPTAVSIIMPFSAVITGAVSLLVGMDVLSFEFVFGGIIALFAVILSSIADIIEDKKEAQSNEPVADDLKDENG
ncbi:MAG: DMT family transporter [Clostridia bacterium]|nr:DMT family transporter [Clostridia bacterium]